jgi:SAM-dependent methyltransferase
MRSFGYRFAGLADAYSIWSAGPLNPRLYAPQSPALWPPPSSAALAVAALDPVPSAVASCGAGGEQTYLIGGWAFVESPLAVPPLVYIEVRDHRTGLTDYYPAFRCRRPDVSQHFAQPSLEMSGFRALVTLHHRMAGSVSVSVLQMDDQHRYAAAAEISLERPFEDYEQNPRLGLARKFLRGTGIEIGALQKPLPLPASCRVRYVDRMALADLLHHYPELKGLPLQAPDIIDNGEELSTIASRSQDFVIANHFLEHCQNPFQTLSNFLRVLRIGGVLFMAVPDKRFTFDFDRPCTGYQTLQETYLSGVRANRTELFQEWVRCVERLSNHEADLRASHLNVADYSIHYNVWTVDDLLTQLLRARTEFDLPFRLLTAVCSDNEAILLIENTAGQPEIPIRPLVAPPAQQPLTTDPIKTAPRTTAPSQTAMPENTLAISRISSSDSSQTNARYPAWKYVIPLPPDNLMWSVGGANVENFIVVGDAWAQVVSRYTQENTTLLDIGCGCGRTARVLANNRWITRYIGFDVIAENVEWCQRHIAPKWHGVAEFHHFDLYSGEYNPDGALQAQNFRFPCADGQADVIFAASVFTHLLEPDAIHYLREVGRTLSARGYAILSIHNAVPPGYRFWGTETRIDMDPDYFRELAAAAGLKEVDRVDDLAGQQAFIFKRQ